MSRALIYTMIHIYHARSHEASHPLASFRIRKFIQSLLLLSIFTTIKDLCLNFSTMSAVVVYFFPPHKLSNLPFGLFFYFFLFFFIYVGCPGQLTRTTTILHGPLDTLQAQEQVRHRGGDRCAHRGSNPGRGRNKSHDWPQQLDPQVHLFDLLIELESELCCD